MPANVQNLHAAGSREGFGRVVGDARRAKRLTQEEAAGLLGMSRRKLLDIEADRLELPRYERAGILAVLSPERDTAAPAADRKTWRRVLIGSPENPRAWLDLEEQAGQWWAACGFNNGRVGGLDTFKGPFGSREAAERNAAAFGRDFMRARDCGVLAQIVGRLFGFPSRKNERAESAPEGCEATKGNFRAQPKTTGKGFNIYHGADCIAEFYGPDLEISAALTALSQGEEIDAGFEQRHGVEVWLANGRSPSE